MAERLKNGQLRSWLNDVDRGNLEARAKLHSYLFPRLVKELAVDKSPSTALPEDLVTITFEKIDERLSELLYMCNIKRRRTISNRVIEWGVTQLKGAVLDYTNPRSKFRDKIGDFIPDHMVRVDRLVGSLPSARREVVDLMVYQDQTIPEIANGLGILLETVRQRLHRARQTIEPELMDPFGIIRVSSLHDKALQEAVRDRRMESFQFLDLWYTDEQGVRRYRNGFGNRRKRLVSIE